MSVNLPEAIAAALDGEAHRRRLRRGDVLREFLVREFPHYVCDEIERDFLPVLDVEPVEDEPGDAATPLGLPSGAVVTSQPKSVVPSLPGDPDRGSSGVAT